jgi:thymidine phosphorylase
MNQVLGTTAGNAVEVIEAIDYLKGTYREPRLHRVTVDLCAEMLIVGGLAANTTDAEDKISRALDNGKAAEIFARMVATLGGPANILEKSTELLPTAPVIRPCMAIKKGRVTRMDTRAIGLGIVALGGGRTHPAQTINPAVGITEMIAIDDDAGTRPLAVIHAASEDEWHQMATTLNTAIEVA